MRLIVMYVRNISSPVAPYLRHIPELSPRNMFRVQTMSLGHLWGVVTSLGGCDCVLFFPISVTVKLFDWSPFCDLFRLRDKHWTSITNNVLTPKCLIPTSVPPYWDIFGNVISR